MKAIARCAATVLLLALIFLSLAWELWWAPLRPGGSWLALKALPLVAPLPGVVRGRVPAYQWAALLSLAYFTEGVVRAYAEADVSAALAAAQTALALAFFAGAVAYVRLTARSAAGRARGAATSAG